MTTDAMGPNEIRQLTVLCLFAHPDDEGFGSGGTLAMLTSGGHRVTLVCATNGDVGEISDPSLATPENLWLVRQGELRDAMAVTGVKDVRFLGYRDSGMIGTPDNEHPDCLHQADPKVAAGKISAILDELQPDLVITHDPTGGYGHPDHISTYLHTTAAVESRWATGNEMPLLYYNCFPRSNFQRLWKRMTDAGIKPPFGGDDLEGMGSPDEAVTTVKDVSAYLAVKKESVNRHRTQIDPDGPFSKLPEEFTNQFMSTEYFTLVGPPSVDQPVDILADLS